MRLMFSLSILRKYCAFASLRWFRGKQIKYISMSQQPIKRYKLWASDKNVSSTFVLNNSCSLQLTPHLISHYGYELSLYTFIDSLSNFKFRMIYILDGL